MFLFAPLIIVPLGMELDRILAAASPLETGEPFFQITAAPMAAVALCLPPGREAGIWASGWFLFCLLMAGTGLFRFVRARRLSLETRDRLVFAALALARLDLAVGGTWLLLSRLGIHPAGIQEPIGLLTAVHFHYAGFATATIAAATFHFARKSRAEKWLLLIVPLVIILPFVVAVGFVVSMAMRTGAAVIFSASVAALAVALRGVATHGKQRTARWMLEIASGAVFAGVVLSSVYAILNLLGRDALTIPQMVRTHGILNGVGFSMTGLLGWIVELSPDARHTA
jgi:hypothetical protein